MVHKTKRVASTGLLPLPRIERAGSVSVATIGTAGVTTNVSLSPALEGTVGDYACFATAEEAAIPSNRVLVNARLTSLSNLLLRSIRIATNVSGGAMTITTGEHPLGATDSAQAGVGDPGHAHGLTEDVAIDTTHVIGENHALVSHSLTALTVTTNVFWQIVKTV